MYILIPNTPNKNIKVLPIISKQEGTKFYFDLFSFNEILPFFLNTQKIRLIKTNNLMALFLFSQRTEILFWRPASSKKFATELFATELVYQAGKFIFLFTLWGKSKLINHIKLQLKGLSSHNLKYYNIRLPGNSYLFL